MRTRQTPILALAGHIAAGTWIIPIRIKDPISRLLIPYDVTVGAGKRTGHASQLFDKIAIVDGSDVLFSLSGTQIDGLDRLDNVGVGVTYVRPDPSITEEGFLSINFGRYLYDKELAFDPSKFDNPQIQITTHYNTVEALCTADHFAIQAYIMEDLPTPPRGFLLTKELKSWLASAAWEYTQMPKDYVYRRLFLQALEPNVALEQFWTQAILQEDNYSRIPFDVLRFNQIADNARDYGELMEHAAGGISAAGDYFFGAPTYSAQLDCVNTTATNALWSIVNDGGRFNVISANATDQFRATISGYCPQGMVAFNLGPKDVIEDWYNPREVGNLLLEILGVAAHTLHLVTEQLRPY